MTPPPTLTDEQSRRLAAAVTHDPFILKLAGTARVGTSDTLTLTDDAAEVSLLGAAVTVTFDPAIKVDANMPIAAWNHSGDDRPPYVQYERHVVASSIPSMVVFVDLNGTLIGTIPDSDARSTVTSQETVGHPDLPENED
jgi:hypothetical protein